MNEDLEYCDAIYRRFVERRAHSLVLTVRDWEQILTWRERDVPLAVVLRVIDRNVERADGTERPLRLTELGPLVRSDWLDLKKARVGRTAEADEPPTSFSHDFAVSRVLEPAVRKLRAQLGSDATGEAVRRTLDHALLRVRRRPDAELTLEQLLGWESRLNKRLLDVAAREADPELLAEAESRAEAAASTASGRTAELLRSKLLQLSLRRLLGVPALRLFTEERP
jgi:hypothetical protein